MRTHSLTYAAALVACILTFPNLTACGGNTPTDPGQGGPPPSPTPPPTQFPLFGIDGDSVNAERCKSTVVSAVVGRPGDIVIPSGPGMLELEVSRWQPSDAVVHVFLAVDDGIGWDYYRMPETSPALARNISDTPVPKTVSAPRGDLSKVRIVLCNHKAEDGYATWTLRFKPE